MNELRHDIVKVVDDPDVGERKNGCVRVFVDADDEFAFLHPRQMLNGSTDSDGEIQIGSDLLARLPHLQVRTHHSTIN